LNSRGSLREGFFADLTLLDPQFEWVYDVNRSKSKSKNSPFHGRKMVGAAVATIVGGRVVYLHPDYSRITEPRQLGMSAK
jgi:dihydroorotase